MNHDALSKMETRSAKEKLYSRSWGNHKTDGTRRERQEPIVDSTNTRQRLHEIT
jgi:hypothetical protein